MGDVMILTKLSVGLLCDALTRAQCTESTPFAVVAHRDVLGVLGPFAKALKIPDSDLHKLCGMPFVEDNSLDTWSLYFVCKLSGRQTPSDYALALKTVAEFNPDEQYIYTDKLTDQDVWSLRICLK
jgi:hypothetical protein